MKRKSFFLLLIFLLSLIPFAGVQANDKIRHSLGDAISLMYISDAILLDQTDLDQAASLPGLFSPEYNLHSSDPDNAALAAALHACPSLNSRLKVKIARLTGLKLNVTNGSKPSMLKLANFMICVEIAAGHQLKSGIGLSVAAGDSGIVLDP